MNTSQRLFPGAWQYLSFQVPGSTPQPLAGMTSEGRFSWLAAHEASSLRPSAVGVPAAAV